MGLPFVGKTSLILKSGESLAKENYKARQQTNEWNNTLEMDSRGNLLLRYHSAHSLDAELYSSSGGLWPVMGLSFAPSPPEVCVAVFFSTHPKSLGTPSDYAPWFRFAWNEQDTSKFQLSVPLDGQSVEMGNKRIGWSTFFSHTHTGNLSITLWTRI